jgi:hypothetical protein
MRARTVTFDLTFANRDLIWIGDPGSPAALVYVKPGARPIATDLCVRTLVESTGSPGRRYLNEARITGNAKARDVYAFTKEREKLIGAIDDQDRFSANAFYRHNRELLPSWPADPSVLAYDPKQNALYYLVDIPGPVLSESLDFLPLELADTGGNPLPGRFSIYYAPTTDERTEGRAVVSLGFDHSGATRTLARATVPDVFRREDAQLGSFDNRLGTYLKEADYRPGGDAAGLDDARAKDPSVTFSIPGAFTDSVDVGGESLTVADVAKPDVQAEIPPTKITIDGNFDDWRNVTGVDDPRGDLVPYLEYVPDVDLLEFKVAHDEKHIYLYARVAGQVGRSHTQGGRGYFYAYMDVDQDSGTGFLPTRDDDCYFGVDIGDDCEVQFEFVNNTLRKTFYGFCGLGGDDNVLEQIVTLGKSQYGRLDEKGIPRANYKSEYIYRDGVTQITEDLKLGTSDTIRLAVSPDGSEVEVVSAYAGFLKNREGRPTVAIGQTLDIAVGMECDSKAYLGKSRWAADSTIAIRGYQLRPIVPKPE